MVAPIDGARPDLHHRECGTGTRWTGPDGYNSIPIRYLGCSNDWRSPEATVPGTGPVCRIPHQADPPSATETSGDASASRTNGTRVGIYGNGGQHQQIERWSWPRP